MVGRADCVDIRASSEGRGNSSKMFRYLDLELERLESKDLGDIVADCDSTGLTGDVAALELARDGGG